METSLAAESGQERERGGKKDSDNLAYLHISGATV